VEGIFSALNLVDDEKMNGSKQKLDESKQRAMANQMFSNEVIGPNAFALVAHGYVLYIYIHVMVSSDRLIFMFFQSNVFV
jgi:hypothetical protein